MPLTPAILVPQLSRSQTVSVSAPRARLRATALAFHALPVPSSMAPLAPPVTPSALLATTRPLASPVVKTTSTPPWMVFASAPRDLLTTRPAAPLATPTSTSTVDFALTADRAALTATPTDLHALPALLPSTSLRELASAPTTKFSTELRVLMY